MTKLVTSSDHLLKSAIEELEWAPDVTADRIGVGVTDGTVTPRMATVMNTAQALSGQATTYPEKKAAATLRVRGVTAVADEILVQHHYGHLEDSDIAREATTILRAGVVVPHDTVKATVKNHHIRLVGSVPWSYQRETAAKIVSALSGVVAVLNDITVAPKVTLSESQAEQQVRAALVRNRPGRLQDHPSAHVRDNDRADRHRPIVCRIPAGLTRRLGHTRRHPRPYPDPRHLVTPGDGTSPHAHRKDRS